MWQKKACQLAGKTLLGEQKIIPRIFWRNNNFKSSEDASPISNEERYITKVSTQLFHILALYSRIYSNHFKFITLLHLG
jgi:hypothetical protein